MQVRLALNREEARRDVTHVSQWEDRDGSPAILGVCWIPESRSYNFALYSKSAEEVTLLFYGRQDLVHSILAYRFHPLHNKTGRVWHARIPESRIKAARYYGYAIGGPAATRFERHAFNPNKILLDPYATAVFFPASYDRHLTTGPDANAGCAPLGVLCEKKEVQFEWGADKRPRHDQDLVIYELHVRGFTMNPNSGVSSAERGTFAGIIEKIPYLRDLGITAVELMPVYQFDDSEPNLLGIHAPELLRSASSLCQQTRRRGTDPGIPGNGESAPPSGDRSDSRCRIQPHG